MVSVITPLSTAQNNLKDQQHNNDLFCRLWKATLLTSKPFGDILRYVLTSLTFNIALMPSKLVFS